MGQNSSNNSLDVEISDVKGIWAIVAARNLILSDENIEKLYKMLNPSFSGFMSIEQFCAEKDYPGELTDPDQLSELLGVMNTMPAKLKYSLTILQIIGANRHEPTDGRPQLIPVVFLTFYGTNPDEDIIFSKDLPIKFNSGGGVRGFFKRIFS